ncbi:MAG TPA: carbohydrate-binding protein [Ktedonobacteraceae bacterium]|nr:carbohydrate-binding protein [Ktedonobacteraceae bacterium]
MVNINALQNEFSKFCDIYYKSDKTGKLATCKKQSATFSSFLSSLADQKSLSLWPAKASLIDLASQGKLKNSRSSITTEQQFFNAIPNVDSGLRVLLNPNSNQNILRALWKYNSTLNNGSRTIQKIVHSITCPNGTVEVGNGLCVLKVICGVAGKPACSSSSVDCPSNPPGVGIRLCMLGAACGLFGKPICPIKPWSDASVFYPLGALVTYNNNIYESIQAHTSQQGRDPVDAPSFWKLMAKG